MREAMRAQLSGTMCGSMWVQGNADKGQKAEGMGDRVADHQDPSWTWTLLTSDSLEKGVYQQTKQNKAPNPKPHRLNQVQILANYNVGFQCNFKLIHVVIRTTDFFLSKGMYTYYRTSFFFFLTKQNSSINSKCLII